MFVIYGNKKLRIKRYSYNQYCCPKCNAFDFDIKIYKRYFHLFFIPFWPAGEKSSTMFCNNCRYPIRVEDIQWKLEDQTRLPFYLYSGIILAGGLVIVSFVNSARADKRHRLFVESPKAGDVYRITGEKDGRDTYYFLRVSRIEGDSVFVWHNHVEYNRFVSEFNDKDYFVQSDEVAFTRQRLLKMLDDDQISDVVRDYDPDSPFNDVE